MDVKSTATRFGEDDEIELELCLSLGGSVRKTEKPMPIQGWNGFAVDIRGGACMDAQSKREIHAARRQEARKKREAKQQQRRGLCRQRHGESQNGVVANSSVPVVVGERDCKRMRTTECNGTLDGETNGLAVGNLNLNVEQINVSSGPCPVSWARYPYPYPYTVPHLSPFANSTMPFQRVNEGHGSGSGRVEENVKPVSNGSPVCSSSGVSNPSCSPRQGGSSSDSGTNSRQTKRDPSNNAQIRSDEAREHRTETSETTKQASNMTTQTSLVARENNGKPPKPRALQNGNGDSGVVPFAQMPCVTTTGNGPEGKTVNGFLYRYSKAEISIVCVCHGRCFSPAEFIRHAGGSEVSHPLRHITVVPSTF